MQYRAHHPRQNHNPTKHGLHGRRHIVLHVERHEPAARTGRLSVGHQSGTGTDARSGETAPAGHRRAVLSQPAHRIF